MQEKQPSARERELRRQADFLSELALDTALLGDGHEASANEFSKEAARRRREADQLRSNA